MSDNVLLGPSHPISQTQSVQRTPWPEDYLSEESGALLDTPHQYLFAEISVSMFYRVRPFATLRVTEVPSVILSKAKNLMVTLT